MFKLKEIRFFIIVFVIISFFISFYFGFAGSGCMPLNALCGMILWQLIKLNDNINNLKNVQEKRIDDK